MVVVFPEAAVVVVVAALSNFDRVLSGVLVEVATPGPGTVPAVGGVTEAAAGADTVVVVAAEDVCGGGTSVDALQICAYDGAATGGGSLSVSGSLSWNSQPSTSSGGLETDCSAGPSLP